jgi:hypothetical protein
MLGMGTDLIDLALEIFNEVDNELLEKINEKNIKKPFKPIFSFNHQLYCYGRGMDVTLNNLFKEVEHYRLLPREIREFLESDPSHMFKLATELKNAVALYKLLRESKIVIEHK